MPEPDRAKLERLERQLREHPLVAPRLKHERDAQAAEAAVRECIYGEPVPIASWFRSSTYQQVKLAFGQITGDATISDAMMRHGAELLKIFHEEYNRNDVGLPTEYRRGRVAEWKELLRLIYGERNAESMVFGASKLAKLSVPHCGPPSDDGREYYGLDLMHHNFIGPLNEE